MSFESLVKFIGKYYPFTLKTKVLGYAAISVLSEVAAVICLILAIERPGILKPHFPEKSLDSEGALITTLLLVVINGVVDGSLLFGVWKQKSVFMKPWVYFNGISLVLLVVLLCVVIVSQKWIVVFSKVFVVGNAIAKYYLGLCYYAEIRPKPYSNLREDHEMVPEFSIENNEVICRAAA